MKVTVSITDQGRSVLVTLEGVIKNRRDLNAVLADRWVDLMKEHFQKKNATPNKLGGPRTNFWNGVAAKTGVAEVTEDGATITVASQPFRLHLFGGVVKPKKAKALTIPLVPEAHGLLARSYEQKFGRKLFTIGPKVPFLFERVEGGSESLVNDTDVRTRVRGSKPGEMISKTVRLAGRSPLRRVYRLAKSVTIEKDEEALPDTAEVGRVLSEEAVDFITRQNRKGGRTP